MEVHANDLINGLVKKGHKLAVISSFHPENKQIVMVNEHLKYYFVGGNTLKSYDEFMKNSANLFNELIKTEHFDVLYSESDFAMGLVKYCEINLPLVVLHHGFFMDEVKTRMYRGDLRGKLSSLLFYFKFRFNRWEVELLKRCTYLIVINNNNFHDFENNYPFLKGKVRLVFNGIDTNMFRRFENPDVKNELNINTDRILLFTGRIEKEKGVHKIIQIFLKLIEEFPDSILLILGEGNMKNELVEWVRMNDLEGHIMFLGKVPYERLPEYYSLAKIFIFPTLRYEGLPYNLIEALSCGCVVIASKRGGITSIIESEHNGVLIDPLDENDILSAIKKVYNDKELEKKIRINSREFAEENLSISKMIDSTERILFESIVRFKQASNGS